MREPTMRERIEAALEALEDNNLHDAEAILRRALEVIPEPEPSPLEIWEITHYYRETYEVEVTGPRGDKRRAKFVPGKGYELIGT